MKSRTPQTAWITGGSEIPDAQQTAQRSLKHPP